MSFLCNAVLVDVQSHANLEKSCLKLSCYRQIPALISLMREAKGRCGMEKKHRFFSILSLYFCKLETFFLISLLKLVRELAENALNTL